MEFSPEMSTTEYMSVTSDSPTYGATSPEAIVETRSLGTPTGSARSARAATADPLEPPTASTACSSPRSYRSRTTCAAPAAIVSIAAPRSRASRSAPSPAPAASATALAPTSAIPPPSENVPASTTVTAQPAASSCSRSQRYSSSLVSSVPTRTTVAIDPAPLARSSSSCRAGRAPCQATVARLAHGEARIQNGGVASGGRVEVATLTRLLGEWTGSAPALPRALAASISELLTAGALADRAVLPSQRVLATALGVSRGTVAEAYDILRANDQLLTRRGAGSRLCRPRPLTGTSSPSDGRLASFTGHGSAAVDLSSGALPGLPLVQDAIARLDLGAELDTDGYHPAGLPRLREAIAARHTADGLVTEPAQILVTNGSQQAVWLLAHTVVDPGDEVVVEEPTYRGALEAFRSGGANLLAVPVRADGLDLGLLDRHLTRHRPRLVYCQPTAHNPTGTTLSPAARAALAAVLDRHGVLTVEDTSSADLVLDGLGMRTALAHLLPPDRTLS